MYYYVLLLLLFSNYNIIVYIYIYYKQQKIVNRWQSTNKQINSKEKSLITILSSESLFIGEQQAFMSRVETALGKGRSASIYSNSFYKSGNFFENLRIRKKKMKKIITNLEIEIWYIYI